MPTPPVQLFVSQLFVPSVQLTVAPIALLRKSNAAASNVAPPIAGEEKRRTLRRTWRGRGRNIVGLGTGS